MRQSCLTYTILIQNNVQACCFTSPRTGRLSLYTVCLCSYTNTTRHVRQIIFNPAEQMQANEYITVAALESPSIAKPRKYTRIGTGLPAHPGAISYLFRRDPAQHFRVAQGKLLRHLSCGEEVKTPFRHSSTEFNILSTLLVEFYSAIFI